MKSKDIEVRSSTIEHLKKYTFYMVWNKKRYNWERGHRTVHPMLYHYESVANSKAKKVKSAEVWRVCLYPGLPASVAFEFISEF